MPDEFEPQRIQRIAQEPVKDPHWAFYQGELAEALKRVELVLQFGREWHSLRFATNYTRRLAECIFHMQWIMLDVPSRGSRFASCASSVSRMT